ncbi:uncharacterized protein [Dysidea avara]|uniref:uncharacterized protein n=1 Tax=Dysidea avara TaxID=196820 RepID=UPI0033290565
MFLRVLLSFVLFLPLVTLARDSCPFYDIDIEAKLAKVSMVNHKDATCRKPRFPYTYPRPLRCSFEWEDRNKLKRTVLKYLKERFKVLLYFKTHVKGYNNHEVNYFNYTGWITWVWVLKDYKYLLNYPHNFYTLSLATTDIIIEEFEVKGKCDENCTKTIGYKSCGLGQKELVSFLQEVTKDTSFVWEKVCLHANIVKWPYPRGMVQQSKGIEYQLLANIMEERIFLITDMHFWSFIYKRSCGLFEGPQHYSIIIQWICYPFMMCLKIIVVIISVVVSILYFLIPWLYFCKEIFNAVVRGERNTYNKNKTIFHLFMVTFHGLGLLILFVFSMLCVFVYCFFLAEVTVYTLIGCVLTPDKAYKYIVLVGAFVGAIYFMINQLQGSYSEILDEIIGSFHDESRLQLLQKDLTANVSLNRKDEDDSIRYSISITRNTPIGSCRGVSTSTNSIPPSNVLMSFDGITTKVSKELFHGIVEQYQPLRKKVFTIIVRVAIMLFYIVVTMHAKNVYHLEKNVSNIFGLAQGLAISFVPAVMTFLGFKNRFGKKKTVLLKVNIHQAILHYIENCKV